MTEHAGVPGWERRKMSKEVVDRRAEAQKEVTGM